MRPVGSSSGYYPPAVLNADQAPQPTPGKRLERSLANKYQHAEATSSGPALAQDAPGLSKVKRLPAGRYEHLGEIIAKMKIDEQQGDNKKASADQADTAQGVASTSCSLPLRHGSDRGFARNLSELAQWSEQRSPASLDTALMFGSASKVPSRMIKGIVDREVANLEKDLGKLGIALQDVMTEKAKGKVGINLNYLETKSFLSSKGAWGNNSGGPLGAVLAQKAENYFAHFRAQNSPPLPPLSRLQGKDAGSVMRELLSRSPGIVIGEAHHTVASKRELIKNMAEMKAAGVTTLFMEHLCEDCHGKALNDYLRAPRGTAMPARLSAYLDLQDNGQSVPGTKPSKYNFKEVIRAAKEAGIHVIPVDTAETYAASGREDNSRIKLMNYYAAEKIRLSEPQGKWLAFVGSAHATDYRGVPGLAELTGTRSLIIDDAGAHSRPDIAVNVKGYAGGQINPDVVLSYKK